MGDPPLTDVADRPQAPQPVDAHDAGAIDTIRQLLEDARAAAEAEIALVRAYVGAAAQVSRRVGLWAGVALIAFSIATMAGAVGIIMTLARYMSAGWATLLVTGVLVVIGLFALWQARDNIRLLRSIGQEEARGSDAPEPAPDIAP
jgi:hypothetical protein